MRKLSLIEHDANKQRYKIGKELLSKVYSDGFSGFTTTDGEKIKGVCCRCKNKPCAFYSEKELKSERFSQFPKNPSNRVCPVNAIQFDTVGVASINNDECIHCGLCVYRCPFAAIQFNSHKGTCNINSEIGNYLVSCSDDEQKMFIDESNNIPSEICYEPITTSFAASYTQKIKIGGISFSDISEIIVRNTLLNLGCTCNVNAQGNQHNRTEFFAEDGDSIIIGESEITSTDTLSVNRRILDDMAVLISRYGYSKESILPLSVINGLPNKRTDYYEVIKDIKNILGVQISTITYHILFMLHLYQIRLSKEVLEKFYIDKDHLSLIEPTSEVIKNLSKKDKNLFTTNYIPTK